MAINLIEDLVKHDDDEVIAYLGSVMSVVIKNYKTALEANQPEVIWASYGDVNLVYNALKALKKRNDLRKASEA